MDLENHHHYVGINRDGLTLGYTKRNNGLSRYPENSFNMALYIDDQAENVHQHQKLLANEIGFDPESWILPIQKHGRGIAEVFKADAGTNVRELSDSLYNVDGIFTYDTGLLLTMNFADCVPVYVWSMKDDFIGLAHAGWRGTSHNITGSIINTYHGDPADLAVMIGVSISGSRYTVDHTVIDILKESGLPKGAFRTHDSGYDLDLKTVNKHQALSSGVLPGFVYTSAYGTEDLEKFFSFRIEKGRTGRALAFIGRN
ncbi:polyphenol oxidase family protein [Salinicoccus albus]|uniref:polyphenol oxidase family protein n=1 Tax=Salinicoccus albus TaxID=418756 RepID=UPI00037098D8|nr:polyphenol oxidase family protein [Salinicoccus albus]